MDTLTASSVDTLLEKIRNLASRPIPEFNKFDALQLVESLKNAAQDLKHEKARYYKLTFETLRCKMGQTDEMFRNYLLPLLGDRDHEKILDLVAKVDKRNEQRRQGFGKGGRSTADMPRRSPYENTRCFYCNRVGHFQANCYQWRREQRRGGNQSTRFFRGNSRPPT